MSTRSQSDDESSSASERSRSPILKHGEMEALIEENRTLKRQVSELLRTIKDLSESNQRLEVKLDKVTSQLMELVAPNRPKPAEAADDMEVVELVSEPETSPEEEEQQPKKKAKVAKVTDKVTVADKPTPSTSQKPTPPPETNNVFQTKTSAIPPVVLHQKDKWGGVARQLQDRHLNYTKARLTSAGISIQPQEAKDHRGITRFLTDAKLEYHTYSLPEDKQLRAVIRGLPDGITEDEVLEDLRHQGFHPTAALRMTNRRTKQSMPLILVKAPLEEDKILEVTRCCQLVVRVERQKEALQATQCFRCQRFGHAQSNCTAQARCVKCGQAHATRDCKKTKTEAPKCANCDGEHPASYRGCPKCPKVTPKKAPQAANRTAAPAPRQQTNRNAPGTSKSFAEAAKGKAPAKTNTNPASFSGNFTPESIAAALIQMQQMYSAMSAFFAKMPKLPTE